MPSFIVFLVVSQGAEVDSAVGLIVCTLGDFLSFPSYYPNIFFFFSVGFGCCGTNRIKGTAALVEYKESITVEILNFPCEILSNSKGPGNVYIGFAPVHTQTHKNTQQK